MKKTKKIMLAMPLLFLFMAKAFSLEFISTPRESCYEPSQYYYLIEVSSAHDSVNIECLKKPDWLVFDLSPDFPGQYRLYGTPDYYSQHLDSVIISASDKDTTVYQKFEILVYLQMGFPMFIEKPDNDVFKGQNYTDTLILSSFDPFSVIMDIINKPAWLEITKLGYNDDKIYYQLTGNPVDVEIYEDFDVTIYFRFYSRKLIYSDTFHVVEPPNNFISRLNPYATKSIFPNPAIDKIYIEGLSIGNSYEYCIYSVNGKLYLSGNLGFNRQIPVKQLPEGLYVLSINNINRNKITNFKFVKK